MRRSHQAFLAVTLAMGALGCVSQAKAGLINNGTFTASGQPSLAGWSVSATGVGTTSEAAFSTCCGGTNASTNNLAQFGGGQTYGGTLSQTLATVAGQVYTLSFLYGTFGDNEPQSLAVTAGNLSTTVTDSTGSSNFANLFNVENFTFTALSASTLLTFRDTSTSGSSADGLLEKVSSNAVSPVPEPQTLAMLGMGLAGLGMMRRRASR